MISLLASLALASDVPARNGAPSGTATPTWTAPPEGPLPTFAAGARVYVVLATDTPAEWSPPRRALQHRPGSEVEPVAILGAAARDLPGPLASWQGRAVTLGDGASRCTGTVTQLMIVSRLSWMEGFAGYARSPDCEDAGSACDAVIRAEVAERSGESLLVGVVAGCGPVDAEPLAWVATAPAWASDVEPEDPLYARAVGRFLVSEGWRRAQLAWLDAGGLDGSTTWSQAPSVTRFHLGERTFVSVAEENGGCGEAGGSAWAAWSVSGQGGGESWTEITPVEGTAAFFPRAAVDLDGDGIPTFYGYASVATPTDGRVSPTVAFPWPWIGDPC